VAAAGVIAATALFTSAKPPLTDVGSDAWINFAEVPKAKLEEACKDFSFVRLTEEVSSNLGGDGPDKGEEEGIKYKAEGFHMDLDTDNLEVHLHATNEYHAHTEKEGSIIDPEYKPAWPKENGIKGHFGVVNIKPGSNVTLRVHAYDNSKKKAIDWEKLAITFFDLDTGKDGTQCQEYIKIGGFDHYFTTNETEINVSKMDGGDYLFKGTKEGDGDDNPDDPLQLTVLQKNRVVSFVFSKTKEVKFEIGASAGKTARVFYFVLRPALRCAWTKMDDGSLMGQDSRNSPLAIVQGSANGVGPAVAALAVVFSLLSLN